MRKTTFVLAGAAIAVALAGSAMAQDKKILAVVVKGLDNPFFTVMGQGCADWNTAHADSEYTCLYTGPALSSDEAGEVQIVQDLISKGVAGIAISPSNAPAMANMLKAAAPTMPIITVDADLLPEDKALRKTYFGTNNYDMGVGMATELKKLKPEGGTVCLQLGNVAAANINERAAGFRDTIAGAKGTEKLNNTNGWTEADGCPTYTNDDIPTANQQMADVFTAQPDLDAFVLVGGWAQFGPQAYAQNTDQVMERLKSKDLVIIAGDTLPPQTQAFREGRSHFQIGQRPYQMGNEAPDILISLIKGETVEDPKFTGLDLCTLEDPGICAK
ncbi:sugar ABC transporter substrate-binding protein [Devosia sp. Root413D1]|uniref:substrate-binding domain-containing protein n=1 Tax=unclassified Devosia TaxID=196773 RepID=UPI0006F3AEE1|nr:MULTISPECIES: substrate-binding domain-containing protein [unclassified Devosia]KQU93521.1 sugar ABC transporter substrate-binding protein [Devosia sp. Root105]KQW74993.1 sugar ABC transporter substrate-binding protein [Devosia sp. Root413D1]